MITVSLFHGPKDVAAAVAVDGEIRAAISRSRLLDRATRSLPELVLSDVCQAAEVERSDVDSVVHVRNGTDLEASGPPHAGAPQARVATVAIDAAHISLLSANAGAEAALVLLEHGHGGSRVARNTNGRPGQLRPVHGVAALDAAARTLAEALGSPGDRPFHAVAAHARGVNGCELVGFDDVLQLGPDLSFAVSEPALAQLIGVAQRESKGTLGNPGSFLASVEGIRSRLATGFLARVGTLIAELARGWSQATGASSVTIGGGLLETAELERYVTRSVDAETASLPDGLGAVLGAALHGHPTARRLRSLALGPSFDEHELKRTVENCRLEYVYEPDWPRVFARASRWMAGGCSVAWFQGPLDFGRRSFGSRSILADPGSKYARENLNVYLLGRSSNARLPLSVAPSAAGDVLADRAGSSRFGYVLGTVAPGARARLTAGLDADAQGLLHTPDPAAAPELVRLLEAHRAATGAPGLLNVTLEVSPGQIAETPRDAIRAAFGSAVDVLIMGRFLIGKDYWLMRQP